MDGGGYDRTGDDEDCEDGSKSGNGEQGVQGSHDRHSRVLRGTLQLCIRSMNDICRRSIEREMLSPEFLWASATGWIGDGGVG